MRTQFLYVGLLSMTLAGGLVSAGCDSNHTGQPSDPSGPVKLVRIMVQDDDTLASGGRSVGTDLLDTKGSPLSTAVKCDDNSAPCIPQFNYNLGGAVPLWACQSDNTCFDPLQPDATVQGVQIQEPSANGPGFTYGGTEIRLVFNKQLVAGAIETITPMAGVPGSDESYALNSGIVELQGPDGVALDAVEVYDGGGSPVSTSDIILNPFGPAIVIKPMAPLLAATTYTIVVHSAKIQDRKGNPMGDLNGNVIAGDYTKQFTTEPLTAISLSPDFTNSKNKRQVITQGAAPTPVVIAPNDVFELTFQVDVPAVAPLTMTVTSGPAPAGSKILAYAANAIDSKMVCAAAGPQLVDFVLVDSTGAPIDWPPGDYTITTSFPQYAPNGDSTNAYYPPTSSSFTFTVDAAAMATNARADHPVTCP